MKVPDNLLGDYFHLTSDISPHVYEKLISSAIREAHMLYAMKITEMYHSKSKGKKARERYLAIASGNIPQGLQETELPCGKYFVWRLLVLFGLASPNSETRRLIAEGGISLNGDRISDPALEIECSSEIILKRDKARIVKVRFV
ncbi:MAG: hypothetical protein GX254_08255 [Clostridiales bacterium]|jgi:tyrosyl-tRNA synthetase|nr:hypothetical protein [Clostridiales bacterium]